MGRHHRQACAEGAGTGCSGARLLIVISLVTSHANRVYAHHAHHTHLVVRASRQESQQTVSVESAENGVVNTTVPAIDAATVFPALTGVPNTSVLNTPTVHEALNISVSPMVTQPLSLSNLQRHSKGRPGLRRYTKGLPDLQHYNTTDRSDLQHYNTKDRSDLQHYNTKTRPDLQHYNTKARSDLHHFLKGSPHLQRYTKGRQHLQQHTSGRLNPQQHTSGRLNPQQHTSGRLNPKQHTSGRLNPQQHTSGRLNPQQHTRGRLNPQQHTSGRLNPQQHTSSRLNPQRYTNGRSNPQQHTSNRANPQQHRKRRSSLQQPARVRSSWQQETRGRSHETQADSVPLSHSAENHTMTLQDCIDNRTIHGSEGTVLGFRNTSDGVRVIPRGMGKCPWRIVAPAGRYVVLTVDLLGPHGSCGSRLNLEMLITWRIAYRLTCSNSISQSPVLYFPSNVAEFLVWNTTLEFASLFGIQTSRRVTMFDDLPSFRVVFTSTAEYTGSKMSAIASSSLSGLVMSPDFDTGRPHARGLQASYNLTIPDLHAVMISFPYLKMLKGFVKLSVWNSNGTLRALRTLPGSSSGFVPVEMFQSAASVTIQWDSGDSGKKAPGPSLQLDHSRGVTLSYSFHPEGRSPVQLASGLWDCAQPPGLYQRFRQHVHCNLHPECGGGEDEGDHCPFSSPACNGSVEAGGGAGCYFSAQLPSNRRLSWASAREQCREHGGDLATFKTPRQLESLWKVFEHGRDRRCAYVGLHKDVADIAPPYRQAWRWADNSPALDVNVTRMFCVGTKGPHVVKAENDRLKCMGSATQEQIDVTTEEHVACSRFICQTGSEPSRDWIPTPTLAVVPAVNATLDALGKRLIHCPRGHLTDSSLRCYSGSGCGTEGEGEEEGTQSRCSLSNEESRGLNPVSSPQRPHSVPMFQCGGDDRVVVPYTLACDFVRDCPDGSDEAFCSHDPCPGQETFQCANGQCIPCDGFSHCFDLSDDCEKASSTLIDYQFMYYPKRPPPSILDFVSLDGEYSQSPLTSLQACPQTHFRCSNSSSSPRRDPRLPSATHCLPVFLRCNGVQDCPNAEDEAGCPDSTCPGYYRCRDSRVCLHVTHVCDGVEHCPRRDDEMLCRHTCPRGCGCQGNAFLCPLPFPANIFPDLRYLDATGSGMNLGDVSDNKYLVHLCLASCGLRQLDSVRLLNLQYLDLSDNALHSLDFDLFSPFENLKTLVVRNNPLSILTGGASNVRQLKLTALDLSHAQLQSFSGTPLQLFLAIDTINISSSDVHVIGEEAFRPLPVLTTLDLRGNPLVDYPSDVFQGISYLRVIYADDFKLCCPGMLPEGFNTELCYAPSDEISSCDDLLRSDLYRAFLWLICVFSLAGNSVCFFSRNLLRKGKSISGFNVFVNNLCLADCLMGFYLAFIGAADSVYRGSYYHNENAWTFGVPCSVAGVMSLMSSEVSALTICLITLDRWIVLRFPFSPYKFSRRSAGAACALTWVVGVVLAGTPLLVPRWDFYSQTGICIPLPVTRKAFRGQDYSFGVMIVFNFFLFLLIAAGQASIYWSIQANTLMMSAAVETTRKAHDMVIARRLITVAVSDFLCWFPICLLGLLAVGDVPVPGEVNVVLAIFILPLNSALNPFLYTFNMLMERRAKQSEKKMLAWLAQTEVTDVVGEVSSAASSPPVATSAHSAQSGEDRRRGRGLGAELGGGDRRGRVLECLTTALQSHLVSADDVTAWLCSLE